MFALINRQRALAETERRRGKIETYTTPFGDTSGEEFKEFLMDFYRNILFKKQEEMGEILTNNPQTVGKFYKELVPNSITKEDFWQRYYYRTGSVDRVLKELELLDAAKRQERLEGFRGALNQSVQTIVSAAQASSKSPEKEEEDPSSPTSKKQNAIAANETPQKAKAKIPLIVTTAPDEEGSGNNITTSPDYLFNRRDLYGVDQSVNLMDPAAESYSPARPAAPNEAKTSSFVNSFLGGKKEEEPKKKAKDIQWQPTHNEMTPRTEKKVNMVNALSFASPVPLTANNGEEQTNASSSLLGRVLGGFTQSTKQDDPHSPPETTKVSKDLLAELDQSLSVEEEQDKTKSQPSSSWRSLFGNRHNNQATTESTKAQLASETIQASPQSKKEDTQKLDHSLTDNNPTFIKEDEPPSSWIPFARNDKKAKVVDASPPEEKPRATAPETDQMPKDATPETDRPWRPWGAKSATGTANKKDGTACKEKSSQNQVDGKSTTTSSKPLKNSASDQWWKNVFGAKQSISKDSAPTAEERKADEEKQKALLEANRIAAKKKKEQQEASIYRVHACLMAVLLALIATAILVESGFLGNVLCAPVFPFQSLSSNIPAFQAVSPWWVPSGTALKPKVVEWGICPSPTSLSWTPTKDGSRLSIALTPAAGSSGHKPKELLSLKRLKYIDVFPGHLQAMFLNRKAEKVEYLDSPWSTKAEAKHMI